MSSPPADVAQFCVPVRPASLAVLAALGGAAGDLEGRIARLVARCRFCLRRALREAGSAGPGEAPQGLRVRVIPLRLAQAQWDLRVLRTLLGVSSRGTPPVE